MNGSEGLVPTRIVNKNGVATTVHKRAAQSGSGALSAIPAPAVSRAKMTMPEKVEALVKRIADINVLKEEDLSYVDARMTLFGDKILDSLDAAFKSGEEATKQLAFLLVNDEDVDILSMSAHFMPDMESNFLADMPSLLRGLEFYRELPFSFNYTYANHELQRQVLALLRVAATLEKHHGKSFFEDPEGFPTAVKTMEGNLCKFMKDDNMVRLVMRRSDDVDAMIGIIKERGTVDPQIMEALLDGADPAFASGAL